MENSIRRTPSGPYWSADIFPSWIYTLFNPKYSEPQIAFCEIMKRRTNLGSALKLES